MTKPERNLRLVKEIPEDDVPELGLGGRTLFDTLHVALLRVHADQYPLDITEEVAGITNNRVTIMARRTAAGLLYISEKFRSFTPVRREGDVVSQPPRAWINDTITTHLSMGGSDELLVAQRTMWQDLDPETRMPIPGRFTGPAEFEILESMNRQQELSRIAGAIISITERAI